MLPERVINYSQRNECLWCVTLIGSIALFTPMGTNKSDLFRKSSRKFPLIPPPLKKPHSFWALEVLNIVNKHFLSPLHCIQKTNWHSRLDYRFRNQQSPLLLLTISSFSPCLAERNNSNLLQDLCSNHHLLDRWSSQGGISEPWFHQQNEDNAFLLKGWQGEMR